MLCVKVRLNREAEFDPEVQVEIEKNLDFIPLEFRHKYRTRQLEFTYSTKQPLTIVSIEEEVRLGTS